jgi:peptidoglycan/xylan/chitin deacetylase (PgdA/CDA1 family)
MLYLRQFLKHSTSLFIALILVAPSAQAAQHINVLLYHHVSADTPRSTSISPDEFAGHMAYLQEQGYQVIELGKALSLLQAGEEVPDKSVAITFDDAWRNIYTNGLPILEQYNYPFTVFVNTDPVDQNNRMAMTWDMLRDMKQRGGTLANHTTDHDYLVRKADYGSQWLADTLANIDKAQQRLEAETGATPKWLAYPYGEYNQTLKQALKERGYIAFGQHSGGIAHFSDWQALPRFPAAGMYSNLKTLKLKLASQPMPIDYNALPDPVIRLDQAHTNPPVLNVNMLTKEKKGVRDQLSCFILGSPQKPVWQDQQNWHITAEAPLPSERSRYNCTAPIWGQKNYYWMSHQWLVYEH